MHSSRTTKRRTWLLPLRLIALGCRAHSREVHQLFGQAYVDSSGIDVVSATPIESGYVINIH